MTTHTEHLDHIVRTRRSVRRFAADPVPEATLDRILEAARWAPTAGNRQQYRLLVVEDRDLVEAMGRAVEAKVAAIRREARSDARDSLSSYLDNFVHFVQAPLVVVPLYRGGADLLAAGAGEVGRRQGGSEADALSSVAAVVTTMLLAAHAAGLGACWMTGPLVAREELEALLPVPRGWSIAALVPLGVPAETPAPPPRRTLDKLVKRLAGGDDHPHPEDPR